MADFKVLEAAAKAAGFQEARHFDPAGLTFLPAVRDMCAENRCGSYGKNWSCPPGCGSLEESVQKAAAFDHGVLVQTVATLEDEFDYETMESAAEEHRANFTRFCDLLAREGFPIFPMGIGACTRCESCTYPDAPCRFPEKMIPSMEARGLLVSDVCKLAGAPYYYGKGTLSYTSCVLY